MPRHCPEKLPSLLPDIPVSLLASGAIGTKKKLGQLGILPLPRCSPETAVKCSFCLVTLPPFLAKAPAVAAGPDVAWV